MQVTPIQRIFSAYSPISNEEYNEKYIEILISKILESKLKHILSELPEIQLPLQLPKQYRRPAAFSESSYRTNNVVVPYAVTATTSWSERIIFFIMGIFFSTLVFSLYGKMKKRRY